MAALKSIGDTKALDIDGYNAKFFMEAWEIIGKDVKAAVYDFFEHGRLYRAVNFTIVTLILKFPNTNKMKDMRPIAFCIVLYKILSKILTNILRKVINIVVDYSQSTFVPRKVIQDNIIIAHELLRGYNRKHIFLRCSIQIALEDIMKETSFPSKSIKWTMHAETPNHA
ncbi:uncharacterized protein LOC131634689 [Vicia villosa]|uniref:uncharacterized protein LOC131634689 n=1 Tax=Vicia villosa TaxID=3911 RepID=UPI00273CE306|nr:uncharacterized protein LOC131634689 [Vicia villosa]